MLPFLIPMTAFDLLFTSHVDLAVYANYLHDILIDLQFFYKYILGFVKQALVDKYNPTLVLLFVLGPFHQKLIQFLIDIFLF